MSLDLLALKALVGVARVSLEEARIVLDDTRANAEDLSDVTLRPVWSVLEARVRNRQPLDVVGVKHALKSQPAAVQAVAVDCLLDPELGQPRERLGLLRETAIRRRLVDAMRSIVTATKGEATLSELDALTRRLPALLSSGSSRVRNCAGDGLAMMDRLDAFWNGKGEPRLHMGMGELDEVLGGLINNLIVLGARPGVGKSALVAGLVKNWIGEGVKVGVLCYEDDARDMHARVIASIAGVEVKHARGDLMPNPAQQSMMVDGFDWFTKREHLLEVDDARPSGSSADVLRSMRQMVDRGCRVVVLDNLTCVRLDGPTDTRHDLLVAQTLADIRGEAQALRVPAIVVGHLKRGDGVSDEATKPPKLSDFSSSTAWDSYARVALGMWRGENGPCLRVLKQTNGPSGQDFDVDFNAAAALVVGMRRMREPEPNQAPQRRAYSRSSKQGSDFAIRARGGA